MEELFYIETLEHNHSGGFIRCWWKPKSQGYTYDLSKAGKYPRAEAEEIEAGANTNNSKNERIWPCSVIDEGREGAVIRAVLA